MSQVELYQSVLLKLGQLPVHKLAILDNYLTLLTQMSKTLLKTEGIAHLAGSWKSWDNSDFEEFLHLTRQTRDDLFTPRAFNL